MVTVWKYYKKQILDNPQLISLKNLQGVYLFILYIWAYLFNINLYNTTDCLGLFGARVRTTTVK